MSKSPISSWACLEFVWDGRATLAGFSWLFCDTSTSFLMSRPPLRSFWLSVKYWFGWLRENPGSSTWNKQNKFSKQMTILAFEIKPGINNCTETGYTGIFRLVASMQSLLSFSLWLSLSLMNSWSCITFRTLRNPYVSKYRGYGCLIMLQSQHAPDAPHESNFQTHLSESSAQGPYGS